MTSDTCDLLKFIDRVDISTCTMILGWDLSIHVPKRAFQQLGC